MSKTPNDTGSSVSDSTLIHSPARSTIASKTCVLLPIILSLIAIFSTSLPSDTQSQMMMGLPVILWFWFAIALLICASSFFFAVQVINAKEDGLQENVQENQAGSNNE